MARDLGLGDLHRTRCVARVLMGGYIPRDALHQPTGEPWGKNEHREVDGVEMVQHAWVLFSRMSSWYLGH